MTSFEFFVHHPGQLLRGFENPIFQSTVRNFDWNKSALQFKISQVSILRKRPDANAPCNKDIEDDDLYVMKRIIEAIGCNFNFLR